MARPDLLEQERRETLAALDRLLDDRRIDEGEHRRRTEVARRALDETELAAVRPAEAPLAEAPRVEGPSPEPGLAAPTPATAPHGDPADERGYVFACMGGSVRKGPWEPPELLYAIACMGGIELDFRQAAMLEGVTEVQVFALMGGINITVPEDIDVEVNGFGFMGAFDHVSKHAPEPGRPLLRIKGLALMGGVSVKVKPQPGQSAGARLAKRFRELV